MTLKPLENQRDLLAPKLTSDERKELNELMQSPAYDALKKVADWQLQAIMSSILRSRAVEQSEFLKGRYHGLAMFFHLLEELDRKELQDYDDLEASFYEHLARQAEY